jgi:ferritin-like metal-binding protein YciE
MTIRTFSDLYVDQLQDLYSANKQALDMTKQLQRKATAPALQDALTEGVKGISVGLEQVKQLIEQRDANPNGEFCRGMEGLTREARAHAIDAEIADNDVRDASIIAQYQRMAHYAMAGYGTAAAFAERLGWEGDVQTLRNCLEETRSGDHRLTGIAVGKVNKEAVGA